MKMFRLFGWVLVFLVTSSFTVQETYAGEPSVYHIHSPKGNFFMAPHMTITSTQAQYIFKKDITNCTCKVSCSAIACKAWSVVKLSAGMVECRLAQAGPTSIIPVENMDATYFFREDSVEGDYFFPEVDRLLYVELNLKTFFDIGNTTCGHIPGHRLMIMKTEMQYSYFQNHYGAGGASPVVVDLKKIMTGLTAVQVWGDGTLYSETELDQGHLQTDSTAIKDIYIFSNGRLNDKHRIGSYTIICQANPFGVEW